MERSETNANGNITNNVCVHHKLQTTTPMFSVFDVKYVIVVHVKFYRDNIHVYPPKCDFSKCLISYLSVSASVDKNLIVLYGWMQNKML